MRRGLGGSILAIYESPSPPFPRAVVSSRMSLPCRQYIRSRHWPWRLDKTAASEALPGTSAAICAWATIDRIPSFSYFVYFVPCLTFASISANDDGDGRRPGARSYAMYLVFPMDLSLD